MSGGMKIAMSAACLGAAYLSAQIGLDVVRYAADFVGGGFVGSAIADRWVR